MTDTKLAFMNLNRPGNNGMETTICIHHRKAPADWDWVLLRYPTDILDTRESEVVHTFDKLGRKGETWEDVLKWTTQYLADHPDDGFSFV